MSEHTPTPWKTVSPYTVLIGNGQARVIAIQDIGSRTLVTTSPSVLPGEQHDNAEYIVLACNSHQDMVKMLDDVAKRITDSDEWWMDDPDRGGFDLEAIEALVAKATT